MKIIDPKEVSTGELHGYLLGAIAPRPIAFVSTIDPNGNVNLSPFSFFNIFGTNPPVLIFSPSRRVRDNTNKHSLENILQVKEAVINIVNFSMVEQMSLASTEYEKGIDEFIKSGLTPVPSELVKPPRVAESPAAFECKVSDVIETGTGPGAGNLIICEVVLAHIDERILDSEQKVDPGKLDAVARMGGDWYCRAYGDALFKLPKPLRNKGIGVDQIPAAIRDSSILSGNNLGRLANIEMLPSSEEVKRFKEDPLIKALFIKYHGMPDALQDQLHILAKQYLEEGEVEKAWFALLQFHHPK